MFHHPSRTSCSFRQTLLNFFPRRILSMAKKNSFQAIAAETKKKRKYTKWLVTAAVAKKRSSVPILIPLGMRRALNKNKPPISTSRCCCCRRDMCYARPLKTLRCYLSNGNNPLPFSTKPGQTDVGTPPLPPPHSSGGGGGSGPSNSPSQSVVLHNIKKSRL